MHEQARKFTLFCKSLFPEHFRHCKVLDVGSGDINGNNRFLFDSCHYEGNDVYAANNVTIVSKTSALPFDDASFDTIVSTECFEHDPEWMQSLWTIVRLLKPGGLLCFTCASTGRNEHGTRRCNPGDSYGTIGKVEDWMDHYKNLTLDDIRSAVNLEEVFEVWDAYYSPENKDLYFYGKKRGGHSPAPFCPIYTESSSLQVK